MRRVVIAGLAVGAAVLMLAALQAALAREVAQRLGDAIAEAPDLTGAVGDVTVCLPCGSYSVSDVALQTAADGAPLLSVPRLVVQVSLRSLLAGDGRGAIALHGPLLDVDVAREAEGAKTALDVPWADVGRRLLPWPVDTVVVQDGTLRVHHAGFEPPLVWAFDAIDGEARCLVGCGAEPPRLRAGGTAFGSGSFALQVRFLEEAARRFDLTGHFGEVPLRALAPYLAQRIGIGVEQGMLRAQFDIRGDEDGWKGAVDCELTELDIFDVKDLAEGPLQALRDALAGGVAGLASLGGDEPLRIRLEVEERLGQEGALDPWQSLALLVREALLVPFTHPLDILFAAAKRLDPESGQDAAGEARHDSSEEDAPAEAPDGGDAAR